MKRKILEEVLSQSPTGPLYHYTNQRGFMGIVEGKEIWATHTQYLNDWREYSHAVDMVRDQIRATRAFGDPDLHPILLDMENGLDGIESMNVCVCSFSEARDSLSQWRAYGGHASGFSIGFESAFLAEAACQKEWYLAPCIYDPKVQSKLVSALVQEVIEENVARDSLGNTKKVRLPPGGNLNAYLHRYAPILKDYSFREEREWRLISRPLSCDLADFSFREGTSMLIPFYKFRLVDSEGYFRLQDVVVGPTPHPEQSASSARSFLVRNSQCDIPVAPSQVPYRSW